MRTATIPGILLAVILGLWVELRAISRSRAMARAGDVLCLAVLALLIGNEAHEWWLGHWTIGPLLTPVAVIGPDGRHLDGTAALGLEHWADPRFYWCVYAMIVGRCLAYLDAWRQSRRPLGPEPPGFRIRYEESRAAARRIFEYLGEDPDRVAPDRELEVGWAVHRAIMASERRSQAAAAVPPPQDPPRTDGAAIPPTDAGCGLPQPAPPGAP